MGADTANSPHVNGQGSPYRGLWPHPNCGFRIADWRSASLARNRIDDTRYDRRFRPSTALRVPSMVEGRMGADTVDDVIHHEEHEEQEGERQKNEIQSGIPPSSPFFVFFVSFMVDYGR